MADEDVADQFGSPSYLGVAHRRDAVTELQQPMPVATVECVLALRADL
jgi:hypothetical protein